MIKQFMILLFFLGLFASFLAAGAAQTLPLETLNAVYRIQVAALADDKPLEAADVFAKDFSTTFNFRAYVIHKDRWYKILLGDFATKAEMRSGLKLVKKKVKDAWSVAPDNDKIVTIWEKGTRVNLSQARPIPSATPDSKIPKARAIRELPRAEAKPEFREQDIVPDSQADLVAAPTPLPGVVEKDLLNPANVSVSPARLDDLLIPLERDRPVEELELEKPELEKPELEEPELIIPTPAPTVSLILPDFSQQLEELAEPPGAPERPETALEEIELETEEPSIDIDDLQLEDLLEDYRPAGELPLALLSPNQKLLLIRSQESVLALWDLERRRQIAALVGHRYPIVSAGFSPDGQYIVTAARFELKAEIGEIRLWDSSNGKEFEYFRKDLALIGELGFSQDGRYVYHYNGERRWWNPASGEEISKNVPDPGEMYKSVRLRHVPTRQTSLILKGDTLWDTKQKQEILSFSSRRAAPVLVKISPDDPRLVAVGFRDGTLELWDLDARELRFRKASHSERISDLSFILKKQHLASVSVDGSFKVLTLKDGIEQLNLALDLPDIQDVKFDHVKTRLLVLHQNRLSSFDPSTRKQERIFPGSEALVADARQMGERDRLTYPPKADAALAFDLDCCSPVLFQQLAGDRKAALPELFGTPLSAAAFSATGHFFAIGRGKLVDFVPDKARVEVYQFFPSTKKQTLSIEFLLAVRAGLYHDVSSLAFSPKSSILLTGHKNGVLQLFHLFSRLPSGKNAAPKLAARAGKVLRNFEGHSAEITGLTFFPDGKRFISVSEDGTLRVWDVESGRELDRLNFESRS
ncbi:MAG: hypothetical protein GY801_09635 [bacterium]|nr:hypothetical protein [bacterium]